MAMRLSALHTGRALLPEIVIDTPNTNVCNKEVLFMTLTNRTLFLVIKFLAENVRCLVTRYW
jgi:hypothetical protein